MHPLEGYLAEIGDIHATGSGVPETSYYPALARLLDEVGRHLKPKVKCVVHIQNRGAGIPDAGLFAGDQLRKTLVKDLKLGALPARGVVEAKPANDEVGSLIDSEEISRQGSRH